MSLLRFFAQRSNYLLKFLFKVIDMAGNLYEIVDLKQLMVGTVVIDRLATMTRVILDD